jgi:hypothetical protein
MRSAIGLTPDFGLDPIAVFIGTYLEASFRGVPVSEVRKRGLERQLSGAARQGLTASPCPPPHQQGTQLMAKRSKKVVSRRKWVLPLLKLTTVELASGEWAVVSDDSSHPLTEKQALMVAAGYISVAQMTNAPTRRGK